MNTNNNNNNAEENDTVGSAAAKSQKIEDRVHTLQASLRQGRDKARRDYKLATERLGLLQAEVQSAEAAVQERETQQNAIVRETRRLQDEVPSLRAVVERLTKEVRTKQNTRQEEAVTKTEFRHNTNTHRVILAMLLTDA